MVDREVLASDLYQTLADIARFLESALENEKDYFVFGDEGSTLQISSALLEQCRSTPEWQELEQRYQHVGGVVHSSFK
ncbi:MAG TPA: hypothetical protein V6C85_34460 [Allocoleopsis sp.]